MIGDIQCDCGLTGGCPKCNSVTIHMLGFSNPDKNQVVNAKRSKMKIIKCPECKKEFGVSDTVFNEIDIHNNYYWWASKKSWYCRCPYCNTSILLAVYEDIKEAK